VGIGPTTTYCTHTADTTQIGPQLKDYLILED